MLNVRTRSIVAIFLVLALLPNQITFGTNKRTDNRINFKKLQFPHLKTAAIKKRIQKTGQKTANTKKPPVAATYRKVTKRSADSGKNIVKRKGRSASKSEQNIQTQKIAHHSRKKPAREAKVDEQNQLAPSRSKNVENMVTTIKEQPVENPQNQSRDLENDDEGSLNKAGSTLTTSVDSQPTKAEQQNDYKTTGESVATQTTDKQQKQGVDTAGEDYSGQTASQEDVVQKKGNKETNVEILTGDSQQTDKNKIDGKDYPDGVDPQGNIVDSSTNLPLEGVSVEAKQSEQITGQDTTDVNGDYDFLVSAGNYDLVASKTGYVTQSKPVTVIEGEILTANYALDPDIEPPLISDIDISEGAISPNSSPGTKDSTGISYTISDNASSNLTVLVAEGLIASLNSEEQAQQTKEGMLDVELANNTPVTTNKANIWILDGSGQEVFNEVFDIAIAPYSQSSLAIDIQGLTQGVHKINYKLYDSKSFNVETIENSSSIEISDFSQTEGGLTQKQGNISHSLISSADRTIEGSSIDFMLSITNTGIQPTNLIIQSQGQEEIVQIGAQGSINRAYVLDNIQDDGTFTVVLLDAQRNEIATINKSYWVIDNSPPKVTVEGVHNGSYYNTDVSPSISIIDRNLEGYELLLNNNLYEPGQIITEEGNYSLHIKAWDTLKNISELIINFIIDKTVSSVALDTQIRPLYIVNTSVNTSKEKDDNEHSKKKSKHKHDKENKIDKKYNYYYKSLIKTNNASNYKESKYKQSNVDRRNKDYKKNNKKGKNKEPVSQLPLILFIIGLILLIGFGIRLFIYKVF